MPGAHTVIHTLSRKTALLLPRIARRRRISAFKRARRHARRRVNNVPVPTHGCESPNPARTVPTTNGPRLAFPTPAE